ncbi:MAG: PAS domain-containing protein [Proteobacteria bacterium]|nr:PAS domain-containing protein [Pseudomonadota bacterium]MBU1649137.1 PAS domain-containing protein [Pseudomonadota bacterium]
MKIQQLLPVFLVLVGASFLLAAINLGLKMFVNLPMVFIKRWKVLIGFMFFFFLGYLSFIAILVIRLPLPVELVTGVVFLGGAIFVFLILNLTKQTIANLSKSEQQLQEANETLETRVIERTRELEKTMASLKTETVRRQQDAELLAILNTELNQILDTTATAILVINPDFTVRRANSTFYEMFQYNQEEVINNKCYQCFREPPPLEEQEAVHIALNQGIPYQKETIRKSKNGKEIHCLLTVAPFFDINSKIIGVIEDLRDISDRIASEKEKQKLQIQLLKISKLESVGQLSAGISHEINTPAQFISNNIAFLHDAFSDIQQIMKETCTLLASIPDATAAGSAYEPLIKAMEKADWDYLTTEIPASLEQTKVGLERIISIVQAMKEFSHPRSNELVPYNLNTIIKNTLIISQNEWKHVAEIETNLDESLTNVPCHTEELGQAFLNILINAAQAIKASNKQEEKGHITISSSREARSAVVRIHDSGGGMSEKVKDRAFDPFFTTKEVGQGSGQGLAIAHDVIVNKHKGIIDIESSPGNGTTIIMSLPLT